MRPVSILLVMVGLSAAVPRDAAARPQVELDHIVTTVNNRIITESDVRQVRTLHLVDDVSSDDAVRRAIENRMLVLGEMSRAAALVVSDADVAARRAAWEARAGSRGRVAALLAEAEMSEAALETWLRDDARIYAYLERQFSVVPDAERARAMSDWMVRLRQRAGMR